MSVTVELLKKEALGPIRADLIAAVHDETVAAQTARNEAVAAQETVFDSVSKAVVFVDSDSQSVTIAWGSQVDFQPVTTPYPGVLISY